jgi:hypothetical protein
VAIKEMVRRTGYSRKLVRSVLRGQRTDVFRLLTELVFIGGPPDVPMLFGLVMEPPSRRRSACARRWMRGGQLHL